LINKMCSWHSQAPRSTPPAVSRLILVTDYSTYDMQLYPISTRYHDLTLKQYNYTRSVIEQW